LSITNSRPPAALASCSAAVGVVRERLLDEHGDPACERLLDYLRVSACRRSDDDPVHLGQFVDGAHDRRGLERALAACGGPCHDRHPASEREQVAQDEPPP
jgi:hypothetical protein